MLDHDNEGAQALREASLKLIAKFEEAQEKLVTQGSEGRELNSQKNTGDASDVGMGDILSPATSERKATQDEPEGSDEDQPNLSIQKWTGTLDYPGTSTAAYIAAYKDAIVRCFAGEQPNSQHEAEQFLDYKDYLNVRAFVDRELEQKLHVLNKEGRLPVSAIEHVLEYFESWTMNQVGGDGEDDVVETEPQGLKDVGCDDLSERLDANFLPAQTPPITSNVKNKLPSPFPKQKRQSFG